MSTNLHTLTTIAATIFGLFSVFGASACDEFEDPTASANPVADDDDGVGAPEARAAPPEGFLIETVTAHGKGCPDPASVHVLTLAKTGLMRIVYDEMILEQSPGQALQATNCTAVLELKIPAGWKVAPRNLRTWGYAGLDEQIDARRNTNMYFIGDPAGTKFDTKLQGPHHGFYLANDLVPATTTTWSECGGSALFAISDGLVLNGLENPEGKAVFSLDKQWLLTWQFQAC